jgi:hypothetical protein
MATALEDCTTEEQRSVVSFVRNMAQRKGFHKEIYPVCCGKCLSRKAVHNCGEKRGKRFVDDEEIKKELREWLREQS